MDTCLELIDTHCHLDAAEFDADRKATLAAAQAVGVKHIVVPGVTQASWDRLLGFCASDGSLHAALGLHPVYTHQHLDEHITALEKFLSDPLAGQRLVAIGEIGLDYFIAEIDRARQQFIFQAQLTIARDARLPVILHVRKAHDQVLQILKKNRVSGGIAHAFNGSEQQARQYIELGFKLGFGGMMTYERSRHIRELARTLPLDSIVLETDAPDLTPAQHRGQRNSPAYLPYCLQALADSRGASPADIATITNRNARAVLRLSA